MTKMTGIYFNDTNKVLLDFSRGEYEVNYIPLIVGAGVASIQQEIPYDKLDTVYSISRETYIDSYKGLDGKILEVGDYDFQLTRLKEKQIWSDIAQGHIFKEAIAEAEYKEFMKHWTPIRKVRPVKTPIQITLSVGITKTGDGFIRPLFQVNDKSGVLYEWQKLADAIDIFRKCCESLGAKHEIESNRIQFAKVEGNYILMNEINNNAPTTVIGTLEDITRMKRELKILIETKVKYQFYKSTNKFNVEHLPIALDELAAKLLSNVTAIDSKISTKQSYNSAVRHAREIQELLHNFFASSAEKE